METGAADGGQRTAAPSRRPIRRPSQEAPPEASARLGWAQRNGGGAPCGSHGAAPPDV